MSQNNQFSGLDNNTLNKLDDVQLMRLLQKRNENHAMKVNSKAGVYTYDEMGHIQQQRSLGQQQLLDQFSEYLDKDNDDVLLIPAWEAVKNGFGTVKDNQNPYCINSSLSIAKGRNYMKQGRDVNSYSMVVQGRVPNIK